MKKGGNMFPPHYTAGVAVVLVGSCSRWQLSGRELSQVAVVRWQLSGWQLSRWL